MPFKGELFLAWKYLKPQKTLISLLTYISLLGPILGVSVLIVVMSVMNGMPKEFIDRLKNYNPHITITSENPIEEVDTLVEYIEKTYNLKVSPITSLKVLAQKNKNIYPFKAKGIYPPKEYKIKKIVDNTGKIRQDKLRLKEDEILLSTSSMYKNMYRVGDELILHSPNLLKDAIKSRENGQIKNFNFNSMKSLRIAGFYVVNDRRLDEKFIIMNQDTANEMLSYEWGTATSLEITLDNPDDSKEIIKKLKKDVQLATFKFTPWQVKSKGIYQRIQQEKTQMSFVLFLIVGASAVGIGACIFSLVIQKTKEIGVLKSIGTKPFSIVIIFISQGAFIGILGSALGYLTGVAILEYRTQIIGWLANMKLISGHIQHVPMFLDPNDIQSILWGSIGICLLASTVPALIAASVNPVKALQSGN